MKSFKIIKAKAYKFLGDFSEELTNLFESLQMLKNIYKTDSVTSIAATFSNIGSCYGSLKGK